MLRAISLGFSIVAASTFFASIAEAALNIPLTVQLSEPVHVTGTPRLALDVGGQTRYANYTSGSGSATLTFTYTPTAGDIDLDGISVSSPIGLNGGTLKDSAGNDATLSFTPPDTSGIKVNYPALSMDFIYDADGRYSLNGTIYNDLTSFLTATGGTFSRTSTATYFDNTGTLKTASAGTPRFDYDPVTLAARGLLTEESRINYLSYSSTFSNGIWAKIGGTISSGAITSPDGTLNADKLVEDTSTGTHRVIHSNFTATVGTAYTFSAWIKPAGRQYLQLRLNTASGDYASCYADLFSATWISGSCAAGTTTFPITVLPSGWMRLAVSGVANNTATGSYILITQSTSNANYTGDGSSGVYLWGAQVEAGAFPTSYIATTNSTVTRQSDTLTVSTSGWYNAAAGSLQAKGYLPYLGGNKYPGTASLDDNTANEAVQMNIQDASSDTKTISIFSGGTSSFSSTVGTMTTPNSINQAVAFAANDAIAAIDGTLGSLDTTVTLPTVTLLRVGNQRAGSSPFNGWIQKVRYYPVRIATAQLQALSQLP